MCVWGGCSYASVCICHRYMNCRLWSSKTGDNNIINDYTMQRTRTDLAVGSSKSRQTLTGVAVDAVHTGAAILTGKGGTLVDGWKERREK